MAEILTISLIAWYLSVGLGFVQWFKWRFKKKRFRPFDCPKCLAFWVGLYYGYATPRFHECLGIEYHDFGWALIIAILCSACAIIIEKGIARL